MSASSLRRRWTAGIFSWSVLLGAVLQMRGALLTSFESAFAVPTSALGLVSTLASLGFLPAVMLAGVFLSRIDVERAIPIAIGGFVLALIAVAAAPSYPVLLLGLFATGIGSGVLHAFDRPIVSHLYPSRRGRMFNVLDMVWAVGAAAGPLLATAALALGGWRLAYLAAAAIALVPLAVLLRADLPERIRNERRVAPREVVGMLRRPVMAVTAVAVLLLAFVESGIFTWLPYFVAESFPRSIANLSLSGFLVAYLPGRYVFGAAADRVDNAVLVLGAALLAAPLLYLAFVVARGYAMLAAVFAVGLLVAGMYPTLLAWATNHAPGVAGPVNAIALTTSAIGFMVFPAVMGVVAERFRIATAMAMLAPAMGLLAVLVGLGTLLVDRDGSHRPG